MRQPVQVCKVGALAGALALAGACGPGASVAAPEDPRSDPALCVTVSVDWEGAYFEEPDLAAMEALAETLPGVPLTHFLNAAYFTKHDADPDEVVGTMKRVIRPGDETGLHLHAWESLARAAGVTPRHGPSFLSDDSLVIDGDPGFDIALGAYSLDELRGFVRTSRALLEQHGFSLSPSFRAGGWQAGAHVLRAIREHGFDIDSSALDARWLDEAADMPLPGFVRAVWPDITPDTQPFFIDTPAGRVLEMPDTAALADYVTEDEMLSHLERALELSDAARASGETTVRTRFVHMGFHQEGAGDFAPRVVRVIQTVRTRHGPERVAFETLERCARRARAIAGPRQ